MYDSSENIDQPLLSDDQPSWVTMEKTHDADGNELPWNRPATAAERTKTEAGSSDDGLPRIILLMRLGNLGAAALLIFCSFSTMILAVYGLCFGSLICCLEVNLSFLRHPIADNFGFLYNPLLRLMFYVLLGMISWSFGTLLGIIASIALAVLSLFNTYVICRYPGYRAALKELADEDEKKMKREMNKQILKRTWRHAVSPDWMRSDE
ncbi:hypothetical protein ACHAXN_013516 [Cyclotella atomus]